MDEGWFYLNPEETFPDFASNNVFIALLGIEHLPPHVVLVHRQIVYSFSVRGVEIRANGVRMIRSMWTSRKCAIFSCADSDNESLFHEVYKSYDALKKGSSCIDPVLEIVKLVWGVIPKKPYLHGLLEALHEDGKLENCYISFASDGVFELKAYNRSLIDQRIEELARNIKR